MPVEVVATQANPGALGTTTIRLRLQNRKIRKIGIYCKLPGITLDNSPIHEIQTSTGKLSLDTKIEDIFEKGDEIKLDELRITVTDTSNDENQQVTVRVQVV